MFNFSRSQPRHPRIRRALIQAGLSAAGEPTKIAVLEVHGHYSGRRVSFFRAFELGHPERVLGSGHVERDGSVIVDSQPEPEGMVPVREPADRAIHLDDERLVFWDADRAGSSEQTLSAPAATWLHARGAALPDVRP